MSRENLFKFKLSRRQIFTKKMLANENICYPRIYIYLRRGLFDNETKPIQNSKRYIDMSFGWGFARLRLLCSTVGLLVTRWMCAGRAAHFAFALLLVHFSFIQFVCRLKTCFAVTCLSTLRGARTTTTRRTRVLLMRLCTHVAHWMCVGRATCVHAPKQVWYTTPHIYI